MNIRTSLRVRLGLIATITLVWCACLQASPTNDSFHLLSKGFGFDLGYAYLGAEAKDMPLSFRNVPVHPDDWGYPGPITSKKYAAAHEAFLSLMYDWQFGRSESSPLRYDLGIGLDWMIVPSAVGAGGDKAERNYMNAPGTDIRGYGAALTFVGVRQGGMIPSMDSQLADFFLNWTPRVRLEVAPFGGYLENLWVGTSVSYFTIDAENGWDRYDKLDVRETRTMLHVIPVRLYGMLLGKDSDMRVGIMAGVEFHPSFSTDFGSNAKAEIAPISGFLALTWRF